MEIKTKKSDDTAEKKDIYLLKIYHQSGQGGPLLVGAVDEITGRKKGSMRPFSKEKYLGPIAQSPSRVCLEPSLGATDRMG
jgi:hypothetical protein